MAKFTVTFLPDKKRVEVERDTTVLSAAVSAGLYLNSACGADGVCGKCRVVLKKGELGAPASSLLSDNERRKGVYLACSARVRSDCQIEIPAESRLSFEPVKLKKQDDRAEELQLPGEKGQAQALSPLCQKLELKFPAPDGRDTVPAPPLLRAVVATVSVDAAPPLPGVTLAGENEAEAPRGRPVARRPTAASNEP